VQHIEQEKHGCFIARRQNVVIIEPLPKLGYKVACPLFSWRPLVCKRMQVVLNRFEPGLSKEILFRKFDDG
jgi:hypothetical protein